MKVKLITLEKKEVGEVILNKDIFGVEPRKDILFRVMRWQLAKRQAGTHKTKSISEVSGTTAKPFRQKGTGNARQGSKRSPHMRGGSVIFGPVVRSHAHKLPKKIRRLGLKSALSSKLAENELFIIKDAVLEQAKTSDLVKKIALFGKDKILVIDGSVVDGNFSKAASNIPYLNILPSHGANVYDILRHKNVILTEAAVKQLEERLA